MNGKGILYMFLMGPSLGWAWAEPVSSIVDNSNARDIFVLPPSH